jgi:tRNA pseudouridine65 synthase
MDIIFQDDNLVAINKPAGLLVHRSDIDRHETQNAVDLMREQLGQKVYPVHRLDKPTAGVLVFALNSDMARQMMQVFMGAGVNKTYLAIVRGYLPEQGTIDYALKEQLDKMTDAKAQQDKEAQPAISHYQRLATVELPLPVGRYASYRCSLAQLQPETGRKHQLRRHMKHIFHPIAGDTTHGDGAQNKFFREHFECHQLLLAATGLAFNHPITNLPVNITAPLDAVFSRIIAECWETTPDIPSA